MKAAHKPQATNVVVSQLINSGVIAYVYCLELGNLSTHAQHADLISSSLAS